MSILLPSCSSFLITFLHLLIKQWTLLPTYLPIIWVSVTIAPVYKEVTWQEVAREVTYTLKSISRVTNLRGKTKNLTLTCLSVNFCVMVFGLNHASLLNPIPPSWQNCSQLDDKCFFLSLAPTVIIICMKHDLYPTFSHPIWFHNCDLC